MTYLCVKQTGGGRTNKDDITAREQMDYFYNYHFLNSLTKPHIDMKIACSPHDRQNTTRKQFYGLVDPR